LGEVAAAAAETGGGGGGGSVPLNIGFVFVLFPQYAGGGGSIAGGGGNVGGNGIFIEAIMGLAPQTMLFFIFTLNFVLNARFFNCNPIEDVSSKLKKKRRGEVTKRK